MKDATPSTMRRLLAAEFDRRGWSYDPTTASNIVETAERTGQVESTRLAEDVPALFLEQNKVTRAVVARAIEGAIGETNPKPEPQLVNLVIQDQRFSLHMAAGAQITDANVNIGSTQINVHRGADKSEVLSAVEALVRAGLGEGWSADAASALASAVNERDDIDLEDVQLASSDVVKQGNPSRERARDLLTKIAASGIGGALATGISAGVGDVLHLLPT